MIKTDFLNFTLELDTELEYFEMSIYNKNNGKEAKFVTKVPVKDNDDIDEETLVYALVDFVVLAQFGKIELEKTHHTDEDLEYREENELCIKTYNQYINLCDEDMYDLDFRIDNEMKKLYGSGRF